MVKIIKITNSWLYGYNQNPRVECDGTTIVAVDKKYIEKWVYGYGMMIGKTQNV